MIILLGKMASGKDSTQKELIKMGMQSIVSYTTRPPRLGEIDGVAYHFISKEDFLEKEKQGFFAETTSYDVASGDTWYYGSAVEDLTDDKVVILNPEGLRKIKKIKSLNPISFYINADKTIIMERAKKRGDNTDEVMRRLIADDFDFADINSYVDFSIRSDMGLNPKTIAEMILYTYKRVIEEVDKDQ